MRNKKLVFSILAIGVFLRLLLYFSRRSLWLDEALISVNLLPGSLESFLDPLKHCQVAPPLFVLAEKTIVDLIGSSELSLRLLPLVAGVGAVFLFHAVAENLLEEEERLPAMFLFALHYRLIYYSQEVKPYGIDAFFTTLLLWIAIRFTSFESSLGWWIVVSSISAVIVWSSFPSILVISSIATLFLWIIIRERGRNASSGYIIFIAAVASSFYLLYLLSISKTIKTPCLVSYWYVEKGPSLANILKGVLINIYDIFNYYFYTPITSLGAIFLFIAGILFLSRTRNKEILIVLLGTIILAVGATVAEKYPTKERLSLYLSPLIFLSIAKGTTFILGNKPSRGITRVFSTLLIFTVFVLPILAGGVRYTIKLFRPDFHCRPIFEEMKDDLEDCDEILVSRKLKYPFIFYCPRLSERAILLENGDAGIDQIKRAISSFGDSPCSMWIIVNGMNEDGLQRIEEVLTGNGTIVKHLKREGMKTPMGVFAYVWRRRYMGSTRKATPLPPRFRRMKN